MRAAKASAVVHDVRIIKGRKSVASSLKVLDDFIGNFWSSQVTFLEDSSDFLRNFVSLLCIQAIKNLDTSVTFVDGGNSLNPFILSHMAKRLFIDKDYVLNHISISRAFTAYQMTTLIGERLEECLNKTGAGMIVASCFPALYLDDDVWWPESFALLKRSFFKLRELTKEYDTITLITSRKIGNVKRKSALSKLFYSEADKIVKFDERAHSLRVSLPQENRWISYVPVASNQTTLECFHPEVYEVSCLPELLTYHEKIRRFPTER